MTEQSDEIMNRALLKMQEQPQYLGWCEWCGKAIEFWCDKMEVLYNPEFMSTFERDQICTNCFRRFMELKSKIYAESSKYVLKE